MEPEGKRAAPSASDLECHAAYLCEVADTLRDRLRSVAVALQGSSPDSVADAEMAMDEPATPDPGAFAERMEAKMTWLEKHLMAASGHVTRLEQFASIGKKARDGDPPVSDSDERLYNSMMAEAPANIYGSRHAADRAAGYDTNP